MPQHYKETTGALRSDNTRAATETQMIIETKLKARALKEMEKFKKYRKAVVTPKTAS